MFKMNNYKVIYQNIEILREESKAERGGTFHIFNSFKSPNDVIIILLENDPFIINLLAFVLYISEKKSFIKIHKF